MKLRKKNVYKFLKQEAEKLPPETYVAFHKELIYESDGKTFRNVRIHPQEHPVNHYRRLKRVYNRVGLEGVNQYFLKYGFELKTNG